MNDFIPMSFAFDYYFLNYLLDGGVRVRSGRTHALHVWGPEFEPSTELKKKENDWREINESSKHTLLSDSLCTSPC